MESDRQTVLLVDDDEATQRLLTQILAGDYEVLSAKSGDEGLAMAAIERPDIILLDVLLEDIDGYEICRALKAEPITRGIPVLFLSAISSDADETRAFEVGAVDFIAKPFGRRTVRARVRTHLELRRQQQLSDAMIGTLPGVFCLFNERGRPVRWNENLESISGYGPQEIAARTPLDFFDEGSLPLLRATIGEVSQAGRASAEVVLRTKHHEAIPLLTTWQQMTTGSESFLVVLGFDITERKLAEERLRAAHDEKVALLREVHHRVKNNMQVITSLLRLQARAVTDPELRESLNDSQNRVLAMSLVHETLYKSGTLARVDLGEFLAKLTRALMQTYGGVAARVRTSVETNGVTIALHQATPIGLVLNELLTNSLKYAFPASRQGFISVRAEMAEEGPVTLLVADDGIGFPAGKALRPVTTLGLQLVVDLVERQLGGAVELVDGPGAQFRLTFPAGVAQK